jgi:hypothetical protein
VRFQKERLLIDGEFGKEDDIVVYAVVGNVTMTCKVVFLPCCLTVHQANDYDGLYTCVAEVYTA